MTGTGAEMLVRITLDAAEGPAVLAELAHGRAPATPASPLRLFIGYLSDCRSVAEVVAPCRRLQGHGGPSEAAP